MNEQNPLVVFHTQLIRRTPEFMSALPKTITAEKFKRVVMTAVQSDPKLLRVAMGHAESRASFWSSCMKAAADGLFPDGRLGAIVTYTTNIAPKGKQAIWREMAQWMPMISGIYQRIHNTGKIKEIRAVLVYKNDMFDLVRGDEEKIVHKPNLDDALFGVDEPGAVRIVYGIANKLDGGVEREIMTVRQIEKVRERSKAKHGGPWFDHWGEMAKKTVIRRLAKRLPFSSDDMEFLFAEELDAEPIKEPDDTFAIHEPEPEPDDGWPGLPSDDEPTEQEVEDKA